jgi:hypothetical protein
LGVRCLRQRAPLWNSGDVKRALAYRLRNAIRK